MERTTLHGCRTHQVTVVTAIQLAFGDVEYAGVVVFFFSMDSTIAKTLRNSGIRSCITTPRRPTLASAGPSLRSSDQTGTWAPTGKCWANMASPKRLGVHERDSAPCAVELNECRC